MLNRQEILNNFPTCYCCDSKMTSMEHVPPKCIFPEDKDEAGNAIYRHELIKVPSCDLHNSQKSRDDEYALWMLSGLDSVNKCGQMLHEKLARIALRDHEEREGRFVKRLLNQTLGVDANGRVIAQQDGPRMTQFLENCARGLYFYEKMTKLLAPLRVTNIGNIFIDPAKTSELEKREQFFDSEMGACEAKGANPDVFQYSLAEKANGIILIRMVFYGTLKHWIFHHPNVRGQKFSSSI